MDDENNGRYKNELPTTTVDERCIFKDQVSHRILDCMYRKYAVHDIEVIQRPETVRAIEPFLFRCYHLTDGAHIKPLDIIKMTKVCINSSSSCVLIDCLFVDNTETLLRYAHFFETQYSLKFIDVQYYDIIVDIRTDQLDISLSSITNDRQYRRTERIFYKMMGPSNIIQNSQR